MLKPFFLISLTLFTTLPAWASSDDAWAEFAAKVEDRCVEATNGMLEDARAIVDPLGSDSYGLAIVTGLVATGQQSAIVCVFDKQSETVQIGGELSITVTPNT